MYVLWPHVHVLWVHVHVLWTHSINSERNKVMFRTSTPVCKWCIKDLKFKVLHYFFAFFLFCSCCTGKYNWVRSLGASCSTVCIWAFWPHPLYYMYMYSTHISVSSLFCHSLLEKVPMCLQFIIIIFFSSVDLEEAKRKTWTKVEVWCLNILCIYNWERWYDVNIFVEMSIKYTTEIEKRI